jgi:capsid assembly protease
MALTREKSASLLLGPWACEYAALEQGLDAVRSMAHMVEPQAEAAMVHDDMDDRPPKKPYQIHNGTALVGIDGPMTKHRHSFMAITGGTATAETRRHLRQAQADSEVDSILLVIDSPGGTAHGTGDLAEDVRKIAQAHADGEGKPIYAYCEDITASAAYWVASQANEVIASPHADVGSIGAYAVLYDTSKMMAAEGVEVKVFRSLKLKGGTQQGESHTKEMDADMQRRIDELHAGFAASVANARPDLTVKKINGFEGKVFNAETALELGLIDRIASLDEAVEFTKQGAITMAEDNAQALADAKESGKTEGYEKGLAEGKTEGQTEERTRVQAVIEACGGDAELAVQQIQAGASVEDATKARVDALEQKLKDQESAHAQALEEAKGQAALGDTLATEETQGGETQTEGGTKTEGEDKYADVSDVNTRIELEWEDNHNKCRDQFKAISAYAGWRKHQLGD